MMKKKIILVIIILLVAGAAAGGYFYWGKMKNSGQDNFLKGLLPSMQTNPFESKPDLNPVNKVNPYKNIKTNPFE